MRGCHTNWQLPPGPRGSRVACARSRSVPARAGTKPSRAHHRFSVQGPRFIGSLCVPLLAVPLGANPRPRLAARSVASELPVASFRRRLGEEEEEEEEEARRRSCARATQTWPRAPLATRFVALLAACGADLRSRDAGKHDDGRGHRKLRRQCKRCPSVMIQWAASILLGIISDGKFCNH
jgi:hypothetical protein